MTAPANGGSARAAAANSSSNMGDRRHTSHNERNARTPPAAAMLSTPRRLSLVHWILIAMALGTLIGWALDQLFGTWPMLFITLMVLGTVSGFWSIIKLSTAKPKKDR